MAAVRVPWWKRITQLPSRRTQSEDLFVPSRRYVTRATLSASTSTVNPTIWTRLASDDVSTAAIEVRSHVRPLAPNSTKSSATRSRRSPPATDGSRAARAYSNRRRSSRNPIAPPTHLPLEDCHGEPAGTPAALCGQDEIGAERPRRGEDEGIGQPQRSTVRGSQRSCGSGDLSRDGFDPDRQGIEQVVDDRYRFGPTAAWPDKAFGVGRCRQDQSSAAVTRLSQSADAHLMVRVACVEQRDDDARVEDRQSHSSRSWSSSPEP